MWEDDGHISLLLERCRIKRMDDREREIRMSWKNHDTLHLISRSAYGLDVTEMLSHGNVFLWAHVVAVMLKDWKTQQNHVVFSVIPPFLNICMYKNKRSLRVWVDNSANRTQHYYTTVSWRQTSDEIKLNTMSQSYSSDLDSTCSSWFISARSAEEKPDEAEVPAETGRNVILSFCLMCCITISPILWVCHSVLKTFNTFFWPSQIRMRKLLQFTCSVYQYIQFCIYISVFISKEMKSLLHKWDYSVFKIFQKSCLFILDFNS